MDGERGDNGNGCLWLDGDQRKRERFADVATLASRDSSTGQREAPGAFCIK